MLPKTNRLTKTKEIERVWKTGRSFFTPGLQVKIVKNGLAVSRFAVVAGTKADKRAVVRNLWRRRVREVLYAKLAEIAVGYDVVVFAKKEGITASFAAIGESLVLAFGKAGLMTRQ
jgi:ribonuclease P protein component